MSFDKELLEAMPDVVLLYRYIGDDDEAGNESYAKAPITLRANITIQMRRGGFEGREGVLPANTPITGTIIVGGNQIRPRDKIAFLGLTKQVDTIETFRDAPNSGDYIQQITYDEEN